MNVKRAVDIFSTEVTAVLKHLLKTTPNFKSAEKTIDFMEKIYRWFTLHNVHNKTQHIHKNNPDTMHYFSISDDRLTWLETEFITYPNKWRVQCTNRKIQCLGDETFDALVLTTSSTVLSIKYLLNEGVQYVLTRKFSSDDVESFFGFVRHMGGRNDTTDALTAANVIT